MKFMTVDPQSVIYALNAILLVVVMVLAVRITQAGVTYMWNPADEDIKYAMRMIILKSLVAIIAIGLFATIFNLLAGLRV